MGAFAAIYHPVGIPMIVQGAKNPGFTIGSTGSPAIWASPSRRPHRLSREVIGWRAPSPCLRPSRWCAACCSRRWCRARPLRRQSEGAQQVDLPPGVMARVFFVMTLAAISGSLIFNFTTNGNGRLLAERLQGIVDDPATSASCSPWSTPSRRWRSSSWAS
jgi:hypothetical protein